MIESEYLIVDLQEHHLNNDSVVCYSATLVSKETGKQLDVELTENNQRIYAYCKKNDAIYPLVTEKKNLTELRIGEQVVIDISVVRTDI